MFLEVPHIKDFFLSGIKEAVKESFGSINDEIHNVQGHWEYIVTSANKEFSHKGDCYIEQKGKSIRIQGVRQYTCSINNQEYSYESVNIPWSSQWAEICDDNVLRFDYSITITEGSRHRGINIEAICRLNLNSIKSCEIIGNYFVLPPIDEAMKNCPWETIRFSRIEPHAEISPPTPEELKKELETKTNKQLHRMLDPFNV